MDSQPNAVDEITKDPFLHKIVRKSFRIPLENNEVNWVQIGEKKYPIRDICLDGIGITLEEAADLSISDTLMDCELHVDGFIIKGLNGRVIHFSLNSGQDWQCGIQWIAIDKESAQKISNKVSDLKDELLKREDDAE